MLRRIMNSISNDNMSLRDRLFRVILLLTSIMSIVSIVECLFLEQGIASSGITILGLLTVVGVSIIATFKYNKMEIAVWLIGFLITLVFFPSVYFTSGGITGGACCWFSMGIFYVFLMFNGWKLYLMLGLNIAVDLGTYVIGYLHPEYIKPLKNHLIASVDSAFAVIVIGIVTGIVMKFQADVFQKERLKTEDQKKKLEQVSEAKNMFFARISHEIRTPINTVIGLNEINLRENISEEIAENCVSIQNASEMLLGLVNELLDLSQIESNRMSIFEKEYETKELIYSAVNMVFVRMKQKGLKFYVDVDEMLPSVLFGDSKRIRQILINLLTNAVKYTDKGEVALLVDFENVSEESVKLVVAVSDTGQGIRKENIPYLYDYFHRIDEMRNGKVEGNGLGLSITKQLLELMGGNITVDSIYTKGTTFTISVDQKIVDKNPIGKIDFLSMEKGKNMKYVPGFRAPEAKILIVDDNEMNLEVEKKLLRDTMVQIHTAVSGSEALELTRQNFYHLIFLDYMMPGLDGTETLQAIRKQENGFCRETPVVCLTGNAYNDGAKQSGYVFDAFLQKPIRGEQLEAEVLKFLPPTIVEFRKQKLQNEEGVRRWEQRKRKKKILITTDCTSDLSQEYIKKYGIKVICGYIETENGRFMDTKEIDSYSLYKYVTNLDNHVTAISASVEEYENFFAEGLMEAEKVIHLSLGKNMGKSYNCAVRAAEGFDHVYVVDSGHVSGGLALMTLYAAKLAKDGEKSEEIIRELEEKKSRIEDRFLLKTTEVFYEKGYTNKAVSYFGKLFQLHPVLQAKGSSLKVVRFQSGNMEHARRRFVIQRMRRRKKISADVLYIAHASCSVKELDAVKREIRKYVEFKKVVVERASVSTACNSGLGTFGISFYRN